jgi:hypothetical protein
MNFTVTVKDNQTLTAGYRCACGCTPAITYQRGQATQTEGCCCGTAFAVGTDAQEAVSSRSESEREVHSFVAPWGERLQAAWTLDPGSHGDGGGHPSPQQ